MEVSKDQPWLGLDSFSEATRGYFYGREEEIAELARRVQRKPLTVLFGQSGLGKTSILRAGLVPRLRPEGYCPVYVRIDYAPGTPAPAEQIKQAIFRETQASGTWTQTGVAVEGESLWEFLHHRDDVLRDAAGRTLTPLLIFDQFEEIFTLAQSDDFGRARAAQFIAELADLVENRPPKALEARLDEDDSIAERFDFARCDYRILISLREDYLAHLEGLKAAMPSVTQNRMRIARMTGAQALDAVIKPGGALVSQEVAEAIVRFVAGGAELRNAEVEPSLLSLICRELNAARIAQGRSEISADLLAGSHATILAEFYQRALADQPAGVHRFIEEELLTESGFRENIAQEKVLKAFADAGAAPDALARLVDRRLLRVEERLDIRRVELTHDVLCGVVQAARDTRHEREAREQAERQLALQREREAQSKAALKRARRIAAACAGLAAVAVAAAGFGIWGMRQANQTQAMAETARGESERLVVYLLDDFYRELEPVGRLDLVGDLAKRATDYYAALPAALRTRETERNRALAQVRHAAVLRVQARRDEGLKVVAEGLATLERHHADGDRSEPTLIGLAIGHSTHSRLIDSGGGVTATMAPALRAVEVIRAAAEAPGASLALRRNHANALWRLGYNQMRQGQEEQAIDTIEAALKVLRSIDGLSLKDLDAATQFAEASGWLAEAYLALGRAEVAHTVATEGREVATKILELRPTHYLARRARALLSRDLADAAGEQMRHAERLVLALDSVADWRALGTADPTNAISWANLTGSVMNANEALTDLGRWREALAVLGRHREEIETASTRLGIDSAIFVNGRMAYLLAGFGADAEARARVETMNRYAAQELERLPRDSFEHDEYASLVALMNHEIVFAGGDAEAMRAAAAGAAEHLARLQPKSHTERLRVALLRSRYHFDLGSAALLQGRPAEAAEHFRLQMEQRALLTRRDLASRQFTSQAAVMRSVALARAGRSDEARELIAGELRFLRETERRNVDDAGMRLLLSQALYAAALGPQRTQARALLAESRALQDALPAEMRAARVVRWWREQLAHAEQGR
jgi:hypothetical protein